MIRMFFFLLIKNKKNEKLDQLTHFDYILILKKTKSFHISFLICTQPPASVSTTYSPTLSRAKFHKHHYQHAAEVRKSMPNKEIY